MWSFHGSVVVGTSIFLFLATNIFLVPIFVENRTFLTFSGVGRGCGRSTGRRLSGPTFSFSTHRIWSRYQFSSKTEHFLILVGWGMGVVVPRVGGCRDIHFRICRTEFSLG